MTTATTQTLTTESAQAFATSVHGGFVNGERVESTGPRLVTVDPSTGADITSVADSGAALVDSAVRSAADAFDGAWGALLPGQREAALHRFADLIEANAAELAEYDAFEGGKPVSYVEAVDLPLAVEQFRYYAGWPTKLTGSVVPVNTPDSHVYTARCRSASSPPSRHGTSRSARPRSRSRRHWPPETRWCSSHPS